MTIIRQLTYTPFKLPSQRAGRSLRMRPFPEEITQMYGVPADLDLSHFRDTVLIQLCFGEYQVQFHFHPLGSISVEGKWELRDASGTVVDGMDRKTRGDAIYAHRLLGKRIAGASLDAPRSISLSFESGEVLTIYDDSQEYESFSVQPGDIFV